MDDPTAAFVQDKPELAARLANAKRKRVMIGTPMARDPRRRYAACRDETMLMLLQLGMFVQLQEIAGNSNLPRARNELVAAFMASTCTDLLKVDDDMTWEPSAVLRVLASDKPFLGAVGCKKVIKPDTDPNKWCVRFLDGPVVQDEMGNLLVRDVGTGFVKMNRTVFAQLAEMHPDWKRPGWSTMPAPIRAHYYRFFKFPEDDPDETGEDFDFCREWREIGGQVWVDPTIKLGHVGEYEFTGDFTALLQQAQDDEAS